MYRNENLRYELKIPLPGIPIYDIRKWVNLHPHGFRKTFPSRRVNNLYFDTIDYLNLQNHLDGYYERSKVRLRWYGEEARFNSSNLEIKSKVGNLGSKTISMISEYLDLNAHSYSQIFKKIEGQLPDKLAFLLSFYKPVIINYYQREYYESVISGIRLTIDFDHFTFDQRFFHKPNLVYPEPFHNYPIIEIKASKDQHKILSEIITFFPANTYRFSKYLDGMLSILSR
jgi:hypothetical protein